MESVVFMGVAGCGKSSLAKAVADRLGWPLIEGDDFHPPDNAALMRAGVALTDAHRAGWLAALEKQLALHRAAGRPVALSCSALKRAYRDRLRSASPGLRFVFLKIDPASALNRVAARAGEHLFPPSLVASQFEALEPPLAESGVLCVDATDEREALAAQVIDWLAQQSPQGGASERRLPTEPADRRSTP